MLNKLIISRLRSDFKIKIHLVLYIFGILTANFLGTKIWEVAYPGWLQNLLSFLDIFQFQFGEQTIVPFSSQSLSFSVGLFAFPLTFLITDIVSDTKGNKLAREFLYLGLFGLFLTLIYTAIAVNLPPAIRWDRTAFNGATFTNPDAYNHIFGASLRIGIASFTAFGVSQLFDVSIFSRIKKKTKGKFLWLRNNGSTIISQFIDTTIFYLIAFTKLPFAIPFLGISAGAGLDFDFMLRIFIPYYIFKVLFAVFDTPLVYLGRWWLLREGSKSETADELD